MKLLRVERCEKTDRAIEERFGKPLYRNQFIDEDEAGNKRLVVPFKNVKLFRIVGYLLDDN